MHGNSKRVLVNFQRFGYPLFFKYIYLTKFRIKVSKYENVELKRIISI